MILVLLPDEVNYFSLLINYLMPVKVVLQGISTPLPNLLCSMTTHGRVCSRTDGCCEAILELCNGHVLGGGGGICMEKMCN